MRRCAGASKRKLRRLAGESPLAMWPVVTTGETKPRSVRARKVRTRWRTRKRPARALPVGLAVAVAAASMHTSFFDALSNAHNSCAGIMLSLPVLALLLAGYAIAQVPTWPQTWQMNKRCVAPPRACPSAPRRSARGSGLEPGGVSWLFYAARNSLPVAPF